MQHVPTPRGTALLPALILLAGIQCLPARAEESDSPAHAPDLRLEWTDGERGLLHGESGEVIAVHFLLRNVGGSDAYAVVLALHSPLGRHRRWRVQPGPRKGESRRLETELALSVGLTEVCLRADLQSLAATDPDDSRPEDNAICRAVKVDEPKSDGRASGQGQGV